MLFKSRFLNVIIVMLAIALIFYACAKDANTGTVSLSLSDSPIDASNVDGVYITINSIEYNLNGVWETASGFTGPLSYNLLDLTNGVTELLGNLALPGGHYSQIRFMLDIPETSQGTPSNPGCYISFSDSTPDEPLFVPSGSESGFKATGAFDVPINGTVEVTADFDVRRSIVNTSSFYILKPTIRLIVNAEAGSIQGAVTNTSVYSDLLIFAYADGTYIDTEDDTPLEMDVRFPNAIVSAKVCDDNELQYKLSFLAAGVYDLVVAGYNDDVFGEVLGFMSDITVESNEATIQPIATDTLDAAL